MEIAEEENENESKMDHIKEDHSIIIPEEESNTD